MVCRLSSTYFTRFYMDRHIDRQGRAKSGNTVNGHVGGPLQISNPVRILIPNFTLTWNKLLHGAWTHTHSLLFPILCRYVDSGWSISISIFGVCSSPINWTINSVRKLIFNYCYLFSNNFSHNNYTIFLSSLELSYVIKTCQIDNFTIEHYYRVDDKVFESINRLQKLCYTLISIYLEIRIMNCVFFWSHLLESDSFSYILKLQ